MKTMVCSTPIAQFIITSCSSKIYKKFAAQFLFLGVVLSSVCDTDPNKRDFMLMLDGKTFIEIARAYVPAGVAVPFGIHGSFYK